MPSLMLALALICSACVSQVSASGDAAPLTSLRSEFGSGDGSTVAVDGGPELSTNLPTAAGSGLPAAAVDPAAGYVGTMTWTQTISRGELQVHSVFSIDLRFDPDPPADDAEVVLDELGIPVERFVVSGQIVHAAGETSCTWRGSEECAVVGLLDGDVVGTAVRADGTMSLQLDWRGFGSSRTPDPPSVTYDVGDGPRTLSDYAVALERGGVVGGATAIDLRSGRRNYSWSSGGIIGSGTLQLAGRSTS